MKKENGNRKEGGNLWQLTISLMVLVLLAAGCIFFSSPARAEECDSVKAQASIPGQIASQLAEALTLNRLQERQVREIAEQIGESFAAWRPEQLERRQALREAYIQAQADGKLDRRERRELKTALKKWRQGRREMLGAIAAGVAEIDALLSEEQKEALEDLRFDLSLPEEVQAALAELQPLLQEAKAELDANGTVTDATKAELKAAWQALIAAVYLPEALADKLDGRVLEAIVTGLEDHPRRPLDSLHDPAAIDPTAIREALQNFLEDVNPDDLSLQELLDKAAGLNPAGGRLAFLARYARTSLLEAFMLTPIFNCQLQ